MNPNIPPPYRPANAKPSDGSQTSSAAVSTPSPSGTSPSAPAPAITGESLMQRLRYFENLATAYEGYIGVLQAAVRRQGGAPPTAYFAPLNGEGGSYTPKVTG